MLTPEPPPASGAGPAARRLRPLALALCCAVPPAYGALALLLGQDANWDLRNYHWYNGYAFVTGRGGLDLLAAQLPSFYNPLIDAPFYLAASAWPARLAGFALGTVQGLNFVALFALALAVLRLEPAPARLGCAALLAGLGLFGGGTLGLLGTTFYDNVVSVFLFSALALIANRLPLLLTAPWPVAAGWAGLAGVLAGSAMGLKQTTMLYGAALCAALLVLPAPWPRRLGLAWWFGLGALAAVAVWAGWWMLHLWRDFGNPLFPYMNQLFQSPYAALSDYRQQTYLPGSLWQALAFPFLIAADPLRSGEVPWQDFRLPVLAVLVPLAGLAALSGRHRPGGTLAEPAAARYLLVAMVLAYGLWLTLFGIYRYLVPVEMLAPLAVVLCLDLLPLERRVRLALAVVVLAGLQATVRPADWGRVPWGERWVEARPPAIADPDHTMVLMAGFWAIAHVLPSFPPQIPFVRVESNFVQPASTGNATLELIRRRLREHTGPLSLLCTIPDTPHVAGTIEPLGLELDQGGCRPVPNTLGETLNLCPVRRR